MEFQDRGAGHIHGTLWLGLDDIENLTKDSQSNQLRSMTQEEKNDLNISGWMQGLKIAFKKLRNNKKLNKQDILSLYRMTMSSRKEQEHWMSGKEKLST